MRMRRLLLTALAVALLGAPSCGGTKGTSDNGSAGSSSGTSACPVDALAKAKGPVELKIWHIMASLPKSTLEAQVAAFNASQNKVHVVAQSQGVTFDEIQRKVEQAMPDKSLPGLVFLEDTKTQWVHDSHAFVPAQACIDADPAGGKVYDDLLPIARTSYSIDKKLWPTSFAVYTAVTYYNRKHFIDAGLDPDKPPQTLQELYDVAKAIKAKKPSVAFPVALVAQPWIFEWWLSGAKQPLVNHGNGRDRLADASMFKNDRTTQTLELLSKMKAEGLLDVIPATGGQVDHVLAIATQKSSITIESTTAITTIAGVIEGTIDAARLQDELGVKLPAGAANLKLDLDIGVGPFPGIEQGGKGQIGGGVWYIPNTTSPEVQAAAWEFSKYMNRPENQAEWTIKASNAPIFQKVIDSEAVKKDQETTLSGKWQKVASDVLSGVDESFPGPVIGPYTETRNAIKKALETVLLDNGPIGPAVDEADATITKQLKSYAADVGS